MLTSQISVRENKGLETFRLREGVHAFNSMDVQMTWHGS
jgi:hypothetical protein